MRGEGGKNLFDRVLKIEKIRLLKPHTIREGKVVIFVSTVIIIKLCNPST